MRSGALAYLAEGLNHIANHFKVASRVFTSLIPADLYVAVAELLPVVERMTNAIEPNRGADVGPRNPAVWA